MYFPAHAFTLFFCLSAAYVVYLHSSIRLQVITFDNDLPIFPGHRIVLHHQQLAQPGHVLRLISINDRSTRAVIKKAPFALPKNSAATVDVQIESPICVETFAECKELSRVVLRGEGRTLAAGVIVEILEK